MEITQSPRKILNRFEYNLDYEETWNVLKNMKITIRFCNKIKEEFSSEPMFQKGSETYELGAEFCLRWNAAILHYFRLDEIIETDYYSKVKWKAFKSIPQTIEYDFIYHLHRHKEGGCILIVEIIYPNQFIMPNEEIEKANAERKLIFNVIEKCIRNKEHFKCQVESILIKADFKLVYNILLNMKLFNRLVPMICDKVEYEGDKLKVGTKMKFTWYGKGKGKDDMVVDLSVKKITKTSSQCVLNYESSSSTSPIPDQSIEWKATVMPDLECLLVFSHNFNEVIKKETLEAISKQKIKILRKLKIALEYAVERKKNIK
jgi:hypothetical protein